MTSLFTAQAVLASGASLAVCDVDPDTLLVTRQTLEQGWVEGTAAVIAVHLYGQPCELEGIAALCRERGAVLIQDACQAHGAEHRGRPLSQFSPYSAYSFYPTKNLGCLGDGGAVVSDDLAVLARVRMLRDGGRLGDQVARCVGVNSRLDEMQACYLRAFLPNLRHWNDHRRQLAQVYSEELHGLDGLKLVRTGSSSVFHLLVARVKARETFRAKLAQLGVQTAIHYPVPLHLQPGIAGRCEIRNVPRESELAAEEIVSLPIGPHLSVEDVQLIGAHVREALS
jgi:dTDP-3-amino-3,4,6-trideoxy-alpha-D-glucose transaminase